MWKFPTLNPIKFLHRLADYISLTQSNTDAEEWKLEVERVAPQLKVTVRVDNRDWRTHLEQMHTYRSGIEEALVTTRVHLDKLHGDIARTLEKISSREKYLNSQLEAPLAELRTLSDSLAAAKEQYRQERYLEGGKGYFFFALGFPPLSKTLLLSHGSPTPFLQLSTNWPSDCVRRTVSGGVTERSRNLAAIADELEVLLMLLQSRN